MTDTFDQCPCCSGKSFADCCKPLLSGDKTADNPLALMRSRYTAHVCKNMKYIKKTMRGKALKLFDAEATHDEWFEQCTWNKLEIIEDKDNIVEFRAHYMFNDEPQVLHERSKFEKYQNQWYYIAGQNKSAHIESSVKIGRNDPCSCGSGKKYKKCCAAA